MPYNFSHKALKMLNKTQLQGIENRISYIDGVFKGVLDKAFDIDGFLADLTSWLANDVCQSKVNVLVCAAPLFKLIEANWSQIKGGGSQDIVALFLVEALRCYNFANHDSKAIVAFIDIFKDLGVKVNCDKNCVTLATFSDLSYDKGVVTMIA